MLDLVWSFVTPWLAVIVPLLILALPYLVAIIPVAGPVISQILRWRLPLPIHVIAALVVWAWLDRDGAIMRAVKNSTKQLVAGEELAAAKQREMALKLIIDVKTQNLDDERKANAQLQARLLDFETSDERALKDDLDANAKQRAVAQAPGMCPPAISDEFFGRLRNK